MFFYSIGLCFNGYKICVVRLTHTYASYQLLKSKKMQMSIIDIVRVSLKEMFKEEKYLSSNEVYMFGKTNS